VDVVDTTNLARAVNGTETASIAGETVVTSGVRVVALGLFGFSKLSFSGPLHL